MKKATLRKVAFFLRLFGLFRDLWAILAAVSIGERAIHN